ncbi:RuBisCO large subunit C-terminal-like domain-containing protein [Calidithermus roseus]|uniref:2,3-diketo-5-methylthiopentyl-1-phosphate enolase n=1 Tax=Calidithermus roseus TaxID=1644118 RepID=A0A399EIV7_9DEIN|nr:RuBisCO large subunit C-terminal-like domain-containing protein [Calidithermus roseus]RIH82262.1 2,3-diketo-5-methylthiopentyl-1-phosphate enolase [Calidithermus roseus]
MERLTATYHLSSKPEDIEARAVALATEQSLEMPLSALREDWGVGDLLGRVEAIEPLGADLFRVRITLAIATTAFEAGQLLNMLFGNCALQEDVELIDVELPPALLSAFQGPRFGIAGLRELAGAQGRPLTCTALKPQGLSPDQLAELAHTFALAGLDFVKDDHGLGNQRFAPFAQRVRAVNQAVEKANRTSGYRTCYVPNLQGGPKEVLKQARIAREEGIRAVMVEPMILGLPFFHELVEELGVPVLAHPAFAGQRIAPALLFGKLFRLFGADAVIYPNYGGRFSYSRQTCLDLANNARKAWGHLRPALPVPAGGMSLERVGEMKEAYGPDTMLLIGGALLSAGERLLERSREFVERVASPG